MRAALLLQTATRRPALDGTPERPATPDSGDSKFASRAPPAYVWADLATRDLPAD
jgi:hypothetical protein